MVRARWNEQIGEMSRCVGVSAEVSASLRHFVKVSRSYEAGLFHCYDVSGLPRTNNDLEQLFGSYRHHERRCNGRKVSSPGLVVRGPVRVVSGLMTRLGEATVEELIPADTLAWQELRVELSARALARTQQRRFRRDPDGYLKTLETLAHQSRLPA